MFESEVIEGNWVNVKEGAEITGYNRQHVKKLARDNWKLPEEKRLIRIRKRSNGYDIWLPDLINYANNLGFGPYKPRKNNSQNT